MNKITTRKYKLDSKEVALSKAVENGEFVNIPNEKTEIARISNIFKNSASKSVNIRLDEGVLTEIRNKARANGIPYQTLIKTVLYQYAKNRIKVAL